MITRYTKADSTARLVAATDSAESQPGASPEAAAPGPTNGAASSAPAALHGGATPELADVPRSRTLATLCLREMPKQMDAVIQALAKRDAVTLRATVHKLKGSAMAITADSMSELAARVQHLAEQGDLDAASPLVEAMSGRMLRVEAELRSELVANGSPGEHQAKG
jgi:HPt (histidine-containing phosphotransfer) domain-containing protein